MDTRPITVLIIEDSRSMGTALRHMLENGGCSVVGIARTGAEARSLARSTAPDVITMDINLPDTDGLQLTRELLTERRVPIFVISGLVSPENQGLVFEALQAGAYDVIAKSSLVTDSAKAQARLLRYIASATGSHSSIPRLSPRPARPTPASPQRPEADLIAIGASTGGPSAIHTVLAGLGSPTCPVLIAQHMADGFIEGYVAWLDSQLDTTVRVATHGERLHPGVVYFPPSGHHLELGPGASIALPSHATEIHCPSVDHLFASVARYASPRAVCVLLTGMGSDGAIGMLQAFERGCYTIAQDKETSTIYGMPRSAVASGAAAISLSIHEIANHLIASTTPPRSTS